MITRTGRHAILEQLCADNIRYMFGNPGTVEQGFLDALAEVPDIEYILGLHETVALGIADGYARATKQAAAVQLHTGVGLGNGIGMMYQSLRGHAPLLVLAGEAGMCYDAMDAQMACDLVAMAKPVTKWAARATDSQSLLRLLRRAIRVASTPPTGPVFLALPMDVLDRPNNENVSATVLPSTRTAPDTETIQAISDILLKAESPMIIMGDGVAASGAQNELAEVASLCGAAVWGADSSELNIDTEHPCYQGLLGHMFGTHSAPIVAQADVVLIIGTYVFPEVFPLLSNVFASSAKILHIDLNAYEIAKNFPVDLGVVADPKCTLRLLGKAVDKNANEAQRLQAVKRVNVLREMKAAARDTLLENYHAAWDDVPLRPARFMEALSKRLDEDAVIFDEALTASPELNFYIPPRRPGQFFQTRGGSLGVGIPGAIGLKLANPERMVVGLTGDGGSMYTIQSLWTAAKYNIGAKFIICNNRSYKLLKLNVMQYWRERDIPEHEFPPMFDLSQPPVDFVRLAESLHVPAARIDRPDAIETVLDQAFATEGPFLIDLIISGDVPGHEIACKCGQ